MCSRLGACAPRLHSPFWAPASRHIPESADRRVARLPRREPTSDVLVYVAVLAAPDLLREISFGRASKDRASQARIGWSPGGCELKPDLVTTSTRAPLLQSAVSIATSREPMPSVQRE